MKRSKQRADLLLVERGLAESRSQAQALIMSGKVLHDDVPVVKSGDLLFSDVEIRVKGPLHSWVSRGGIKLDFALRHWGIDVSGRLCMDIGSSTGGFCDVLLRGGARSVYAIDVGRGQLHERLRQDERIDLHEGVNVRYVDRAMFVEFPSFIVCDVSFIGLEKALLGVLGFCSGVGYRVDLVALVKPQFQLGRGDVGGGGIVRDSILHERACEGVRVWLEGEMGWVVHGVVGSPIDGARGNREFFIYASTNL